MKQSVLTVGVVWVMLWSGVVFAQAGNGKAMLENPAPHSYQSGVSVISGWACNAEEIVIEIDGLPFLAAYGTLREDTQEACGDTDNGFSLLWNWSNNGDGAHTVRALSDGVEFGTATVTVTTFGTPFLREAQGSRVHILDDFPTTGEETWVRWSQSLQNFVIQGNPAAFTQEFVQAALDRYDREGREATLAYYNDWTSLYSDSALTSDIYGPWEMLIIDEHGLIVAHPSRSELIGQDIKTLIGSDGHEFGKAIARAIEAGHWVHHLWPHPQGPSTDLGIPVPLDMTCAEEEPKRSWAIRHDGLIFVSGYYEATNPVCQHRFAVGTAYSCPYGPFGASRCPGIAAVLENPTPRSFRSGISAISGWACDAEEIVIEINGEPLTAAYGTVREDTAEVCGDTDNGFSLLWNWNTLGDGVHTVLAFIDGVPFARSSVTVTTFGEDMLGDEEKATFTQDFVQAALDRYDSEGRAATVAHYNSPASIEEEWEGEWYVFILDEHDRFLAHPVRPDLIGRDGKTIVGADGYALGKEIATATEAGHWVHYLWPNPAAGGGEEPKHSWVIRHDGLIFGAGYYGPPNFRAYYLWDFPTERLGPSLQWSPPLQNFVITGLWTLVPRGTVKEPRSAAAAE